MYIEEIILEGFKSYATRTSISGWDPEFNAITGLNGTGKSNILDAICFVLGIDNLRQVRATSLQDLVYKKGQAGITKAAVTIVFNNANRAKSPIGFADCPQITVTRQIILNGKNKYLINGHNVQQKAVENLFQSVQLNVNNPHFLIMQGQITRVLNMKPMETLALIEETAGTRMFEDRKSKAINTLEKKEHKVEEITSLLTDIIKPKLNSLKAERSDFLEYKRTETELEHQQRLLRAFEYSQLSKGKIAAEQALDDSKSQIEDCGRELQAAKLQIEQVTDEIFNVCAKKEKESKSNAKLRRLEEDCREASVKAVKLQTELDFKKEALTAEETKLGKLKKESLVEQERLFTLQQTLTKIQGKYEAVKSKRMTTTKELAQDEELLQSLETGLSTDDNSKEIGFAKLLNDARNALLASQTAKHQAEMQIAHLQKEIAALEGEAKSAQSQQHSTQQTIEGLEKSILELQTQLGLKKDQIPDIRPLYSEVESLRSSLQQLHQESNELKGATTSVEFRHSLGLNFDDGSKVKGTVAKLIDLTDETVRFANALESCAGGRLYNVVVDSEQTAATLLEHGRLTRRVTFIPLTKIQSRYISEDKIRQVSELTKGRAFLAQSLISFDNSVCSAMQYVFGSTFICETKEAASMVAFDKRLGFRAVTLEGDIYEPSGTLSGGATSNFSGILEKLHRMSSNGQAIETLSQKLSILEQEILQKEKIRQEETKLIHDLQTKESELAALQRKTTFSKSGQVISKYNEMKKQLLEAQEQVNHSEANIKMLEDDCQRFERENSELARNRDGKLSEIRKRIEKLCKSLNGGEKEFKKLDDEFQNITNNHEATVLLLKDLDLKMNETESVIKELEQEIVNFNEEFLRAMTQHNGLRVQLENESRNLRQFDVELVALEERKKTLQEDIEEGELRQRQLADRISGLERDLKKACDKLKALLSENPWISDFCHQIEASEGLFDFSKHNMGDVARQVKILEAQRDSLRKSINFNVVDMLDRVEAKDVSLRQMLSTVKKDRTKIESTILKLNDYMLDTLNQTWKKVSKDFGEIFSELLPGSDARLDLLEGEPITSGLEIRVCLGGVWKQGLAELSGGQRSLVALALILALLQYRPAPMYILDEVDAALDLSHTENIGCLLKNRFKGSQFIVVSLKEGMFTNANVLFRTRFKDGISGVERIVRADNNGGARNDGGRQRREIAAKKLNNHNSKQSIAQSTTTKPIETSPLH